MPAARRSSPTLPLTVSARIFSAAATAASAAAARTSATACASAWAILVSAGDELLDLGRGLDGQPLALRLGIVDDRLRLALGLLAPAAIVGEDRLRLFAQPAGIVEFGLDAGAALVERARDQRRHAGIDEDADENDEGDGDPEFRFEQHGLVFFSA